MECCGVGFGDVWIFVVGDFLFDDYDFVVYVYVVKFCGCGE